MNNILFALYNPESDCVEVNIGMNSALFIRCKDFNGSVLPILSSPKFKFFQGFDVFYLPHKQSRW